MISNLLLSMPGATEWIFILVVVPVLILIILIAIRKPLMWYYGIIDLINESRKQTKLLEEIRDGLKDRESITV